MKKLPRLIGMVHLLPLPGAPTALPLDRVIARALQDAATIADAGFDAIMVENFGDAPFFPGRVPRLTVAAMTRVVSELSRAVKIPIGVNVLRNDAESALAIASVTDAAFIRVNILVGAMVTDQGVIQGRAHHVARLRAALGSKAAIFADVMVKHAQPLGPPPPLGQLIHDTLERGGADAIVVSGEGTGRPVSPDFLNEVTSATKAPVFIGSGLTPRLAPMLLSKAYGAIVGTALKKNGDPANPVDKKLASAVVMACH